ncbi:PLD nuclease N-terminal domain-containing protein [Allonocardiopsis opalescens]|uniref:Phospholipase D-like protein n=1 Tax=Allonocardiopsis opalescens TaxID=1144618 RepID=A0A2T0Q7U9_9ACTN|nr:PLD nuclease N-terminal domain-containing protein [Allonocardiopsis opalescens]PRX99905.1 phospholipase D-like protein [Allonocardiopsis opalescens]
MVVFSVLLTLVSIVVWVYAFFDAVTARAEEVRHLPKLVWLAVILLGFVVGALLWLLLGRPSPLIDLGGAPPSARGGLLTGGRPAHGASGGAAPLGPDDDPEFLRRLDERRADPEE